jgi:hypothetical protein
MLQRERLDSQHVGGQIERTIFARLTRARDRYADAKKHSRTGSVVVCTHACESRLAGPIAARLMRTIKHSENAGFHSLTRTNFSREMATKKAV